MKIAVLGAGGVAKDMAATLVLMKDVERYAVAARDYDRAKAFAEQYGFKKAYGSYRELTEDPEVELVYIATPHSHHYEHATLCLEHGKHVLCEKAFTANAGQAEKLIELAESRHLLVAEAIWTRYQPMSALPQEIIQSGEIGEVTSVTASFGVPLFHVQRMTDPELAGGALLDLGVYPITFASIVLGGEVKEAVTAAVLTDRHVDARNSITLIYEGGQMAVLNSNMESFTDSRGVVNGTKGYIVVEGINNFREIRVYVPGKNQEKRYGRPADQISGYEYEVRSAMKAIREGHTECPEMPHHEILRVMKLMDGLREKWGVRFPFE